MQVVQFVSHWQGDFEGKTYRNIVISNGLRSAKIPVSDKIDVNKLVEELKLKEGDRIKIDCDIYPSRKEEYIAEIQKVERASDK